MVTADHFGHNDYLATYEEPPAGSPRRRWLVAGHAPADDLPPGPMPSSRPCWTAIPSPARCRSTRTRPAIIGFTSGTTRDPKGVIHSHRTIGCETRQLDYMFPQGGPPQITGAPVGHFIGMLNAFLVPAAPRVRPVNLIDVWDPAEVLRMMREEGLAWAEGRPTS